MIFLLGYRLGWLGCSWIRPKDFFLFFQHWDPAIPGLNTSLINEEKVNEWSEVQRSQHLLTNGASFLCGIRLQVYRAEGTTQWYTAVTTGFNTSTMVRI